MRKPVEFAKEQGIAIYARATASTLPGRDGVDPSDDGTVVRRYPPRLPGTVVGVASERDILMVELRDRAGNGAAGPAHQPPHQSLFELLDDHAVSGKQLHHSGSSLTLVISRDNLHDESRVRTRSRPPMAHQCR
jgi:aspartate kinase